MLVGRVDNLRNSRLTGWAFNRESPAEHLTISVSHNGQIVGTTKADILRRDLPDAGIGDGDHAFRIELPDNIISLNGLTILAQSQQHGEIDLPIADDAERTESAIFNAFGERYEKALRQLKDEIRELRTNQARQGDLFTTELPDDIAQRLLRLENRMEAAEIFFVRIDEMTRQLVEEKKKRKKRFLGIF